MDKLKISPGEEKNQISSQLHYFKVNLNPGWGNSHHERQMLAIKKCLLRSNFCKMLFIKQKIEK